MLTAMVALGLGQPLRWRRERDAQCAAAMPLVQKRASIAEVRSLAAGRLAEYSGVEADSLIRSFGPESDKGRSIRAHLHREGRALLFHQNSSIMFVYFDERLRAIQAECFLQ